MTALLLTVCPQAGLMGLLTPWGCGRRGMAFVGFGYQAKTFVQEPWQLYLLYTMLLVAFIYTLCKH